MGLAAGMVSTPTHTGANDMPVDTSIYQNYLKPPKSIAEYGAEMDIADQNRMALESGRMNLIAAKQAQADEQAVRAAYQKPGFDPQSDAGIMELMRLSPKAGFSAAEARQKALKAQADLGHVGAQTEKERLSGAKQQIDLVLQAVSAAKDPQSYAQALQFLQANGIKTDGAPAQYDPAAIANFGQMAQTAAQRVEQEWKQKGFDLDVRRANDANANAAAGHAITMRGQNMVDARTREATAATSQAGKPPAGYRFKPDGNLEAIPGGPADTKIGGNGAKAQDASDVLSILAEAEPLLAKSTGSYIGTAADEAARTVGISTSGAQASAQLKALQGALVSKMPKMSGPQSDKDVQLYREMAGQIGDSTIPIATRRAAIGTIRKLNEKYAGSAPASIGGWTVQEVK